ncbi:MAG TPA: NifB/NifX family molybdenum-iron cluster-binding protein [Candidatus Paceibacterota bacterium]|nr:NifB/NifX family molybdenum-iron cluster-binding protein [Candidatus Pacearchaeota archaeon]HRZ50608.1 NifB/NifX family molybdenum-iron cluster-binding protein [Candidatus Paceibacterota bacterium]HSA36495.1 NifB/NifX family molybdenum-iron cluster-binding protein [Candidatus Paceibacterota bacterium]
MKIAIPTNAKLGLDDEVAVHFGRCATYTFIDENGKVVEIIDNTSEHMGGKGLPPELLKTHGSDVLLCVDIGPRAIDLCAKFGIDVYVIKERTVKGIFEAWRSNKIKKAGIQNACEEHRR